MNGVGANCRPGGNSCWERSVQIDIKTPSVSYSPRELPTALDFLNFLWEKCFNEPLFKKANFQKPASLSLGCQTKDEFLARVGDLNELLRAMDVPDGLLPQANRIGGAKPIPKTEKLNRLSACLKLKLGNEELERVSPAIDILKALIVIRNKMTHGGGELIAALSKIRIGYPIADYAAAWDMVRGRVAEALTMIRESLETLVP